tara:strand:- start:64 stop:363 length:300 start_codon:yes stop_codon:yes gene_type:complete
MGWIANPLFVGSNPTHHSNKKVIMKIRDLVKRLEDIETSLEKKEDKENYQAVGNLIDEIIEFDIKAEEKIRKEIKKFIDKELEHRLVEEAMCSGSIAQA